MLEDVTLRLASFGYTVTESDSWMLNFIITKVENEIKSECNLEVIPEGLHNIAVDMVVGEFLLGKKSTGQLTEIDISAVEKSIQEGDTTVTYAIGSGDKTPEQRLDQLILYLMNGRKASFASFRRFRW